MSESATVFYSLHVDGLSTLFVTHDDESSSVTAWGLAEGYDVVHVGLAFPSQLDCGVELRTGSLADTSADLEIIDTTGDLASIFRGSLSDAELLLSTLEAADDPAPPSLWGKCVGGETIGPAGERRAYSCTPGSALGLRHLGQQAAWAQGRAATPVTESVRVWPGRRCSVMRVRRIGGAWQSWAAAFTDGCEVWRGTLLGQGDQDVGRWRLRAAGPESWVAGNLAPAAFEVGLRAVPAFTLSPDDGETRIVAWLDLVSLGALAEDPQDPDTGLWHSWVTAYEDTTSLVGCESYDEVVLAIRAVLTAVETDAGSGQAFAFGDSSSDLQFSTSAGFDGITILWDRSNETVSGFNPATDGSRYTARLRLELHEKVARILGYDPRQQNESLSATDSPEAFGVWRAVNDAQTRWVGSFFAADEVAMEGWRTGDFSGAVDPYTFGGHYYNYGFARRWPPLYTQGAVSWAMVAGQEFQIQSLEPVHLPSSRARPLMASLSDPSAPYQIGKGVGEVTHHGLLVVEGPYRRRGDAETATANGFAFELDRAQRERKSLQVMRVCWRESPDGSVSLDVDGLPRLVVYEWLDPREFGLDWSRLSGLWSGWRVAPEDGQPITVRPLVAFDYGSSGNRLDLAMIRVLASSGTVGAWYSGVDYVTQVYGLDPPSAIPEPGVNNVDAAIITDAEVSEMGLAVPASLIQPAQAWADALALLGPDLQRVKIAFAAGVSARGLFDSILAPTGLAWSLSGGRYGIFDPWSMPAPELATYHITRDDYAGKPGEPASARATQRLREWSPIDVLEVSARVDPVAGTYKRKDSRRSTDLGAAYRSQTIKQSVDAAHLVHPGLTIPGANWAGQLATRWGSGFDFWARQHMIAEVTLHASSGLAIWPGDVVTLTDPWLANPSGGYGVSNAAGWVVRRSFDAANESVRLSVLVDVETVWLRYAGACLATRYDEDDEAQGYRLAVADDWLGMRGSSSLDCEAFIEPDTSVVGGAADFEVFAFDGVAWTRGIFGRVVGIDATPGACWLLLEDALTGATWLRDQHHVVVLREYAEQLAAWVLELHAPVCAEDGTVNGDAGKRWRG